MPNNDIVLNIKYNSRDAIQQIRELANSATKELNRLKRTGIKGDQLESISEDLRTAKTEAQDLARIFQKKLDSPKTGTKLREAVDEVFRLNEALKQTEQGSEAYTRIAAQLASARGRLNARKDAKDMGFADVKDVETGEKKLGIVQQIINKENEIVQLKKDLLAEEAKITGVQRDETAEAKQTAASINEAADKAKDLKDEIKGIDDAAKSAGKSVDNLTSATGKATSNKQSAKLEKELEDLRQAQETFQEYADADSGFEIEGKNVAELQRELDRLSKAYRILRKEGIPTEQEETFERIRDTIVQLTTALSAYDSKVKKTFTAEQKDSVVELELHKGLQDMDYGELVKHRDALKDIFESIRKAGIPDERKDEFYQLKVAIEETNVALKKFDTLVKGAATQKIDPKEVVDTTKQPFRANTNAKIEDMSVVELTLHIKDLQREMRALAAIRAEDRTEEQVDRYNELYYALQRANEQYATMQQEMVNTADVMNAMNGAVQGLSNAKGPLSGVLSIIESIGPVMQQAGLISEATLATVTSGISLAISAVTLFANVVKSAIDSIKRAITSILSAAKRVIEFVIDGIKRVISAISSLVSKISGSLKKAIDKVRGSADKAFSMKNLKRTLQMLTKYIFGFRSFFFLYRRLRKYIGEGIENLVQFQSATNETNTAITELRTSLLYLKNAWAAAFAPIINYVYPTLVYLMDLLASVGNTIARFFAALTGAETVLQAVRVDAGDYAESLNNIGGSAGNAADEQEKLNDRLAAFDDLNVLGVDKDTDPNSGSGGGGGGLGDNIDPNEMFRRIETPVNRLADMIKRAWKTGDAFDLGDLFASSLEKSLDKVHLWLTGEGREKVLKIGNLIGTFFDGMLSHKDLGASIGRVIGDAFDLVCDTINTIITPERMMKFGQQLAGAMNTAIPMIVPKLGETLGNLFRSAIAGFYGWVTTADWKGYAQAIADGFNNFLNEMSRTITTTKGTLSQAAVALNGWDMLGISITEFAQGMINMLGEAIARTDWTALGEGIGQLLSRIDISGIWTAILNVGNGIKNGAKGIWSAFEANAPEGATRALTPLVSILQNIPDLITEIAGVVKRFLPTLDEVNAWMDGLPDTIDRVFTTLDSLIDVLDRIASVIERLMPGAQNFVSNWTRNAGEATREVNNTTTAVVELFDVANHYTGGGFGLFGDIVSGAHSLGRSIHDDIIDPENAATSTTDRLRDSLSQLLFGTTLGKNASNISDNITNIKGALEDTTGTVGNVKGAFENMSTQAVTSLKSIPEAFTEMKGVADTQSANIKGTYDNTFESVKQGSIDSAKVVQDNFLLASDSIKDSFIQTWDEIKKAVSEGGSMYVALTDGVNNTLKSLLNGMINGINTSITKPLQDISKSFNILRTLDVNGTRPFAGIPYLNVPTIPALAQGAVIPPNNQFLAVLGDQRNGTNIEAPLDTIKQAVGEEFAPYAEAIVEAVMQVVSAVNNKELKIGDKEIGRANDRYNTQRSIIRGTML